MLNGSLVYNDYKSFLNSNIIISNNFNLNQLQPSSIDLTISDECYEIKSSFLSPNNNVRNKLSNFIKKEINLKNSNLELSEKSQPYYEFLTNKSIKI